MTRPALRIESPANPRVKAAARLRERRERDATGRTLIDGVREVGRALDAGVPVVEAFVEAERLAATPDGADLLARLRATEATVVEVSAPVLARLAFGDRDEGCVAVLAPPSTSLDDLRLPPEPLVVVVEGVEKPGNLGAILRSADAAGADAVIAADPATDVWNPNTIRASLGTIFALPLAVGGSAAVRDRLLARGVRPVAARVDATRPYTAADLRGSIAIVLGSEAHGLGPTWDHPAVEPVRIPMHGVADSLNVSVAAAVLLFEARRQREDGG